MSEQEQVIKTIRNYATQIAEMRLDQAKHIKMRVLFQILETFEMQFCNGYFKGCQAPWQIRSSLKDVIDNLETLVRIQGRQSGKNTLRKALLMARSEASRLVQLTESFLLDGVGNPGAGMAGGGLVDMLESSESPLLVKGLEEKPGSFSSAGYGPVFSRRRSYTSPAQLNSMAYGSLGR